MHFAPFFPKKKKNTAHNKQGITQNTKSITPSIEGGLGEFFFKQPDSHISSYLC